MGKNPKPDPTASVPWRFTVKPLHEGDKEKEKDG